MSDDTKLPKRIDRKVLFESKLLNLYADHIIMPNGNHIDGFYFLDIRFSAVAVIIERANGDILLEEVARYPTQAITWELPLGIIEANETMLEAAEREVYEETGYITSGHQHIYTYHPMAGLSNMEVHVIYCKSHKQKGQINKNEVESIEWFNQKDILKLISKNEISDGFSLTGLLLHIKTSLELNKIYTQKTHKS